MFYNGKLEKIIYVSARDAGMGAESFLWPQMAGVTMPNPRYRIDYCAPQARYYVFEYVHTGRGWIESGGKRIGVGAGDFYFYHKNATVVYGADPQDPYEKMWLNVGGRLADALCTAYGMPDSLLIRHVNVEAQMTRIHRLLAHTSSATAEQDMQSLALLLHELIAAVMQPHIASSPAQPSMAYTVKAILDDAVYTPLSLEDIAARVYLSKTHIIRIFRAEYGTTPINYLLERRIETAKSLLNASQMTVGEIAEMLQFNDSQHFSHCFKRRTGVSPTDYRRTCARGQENKLE